MTGGSDLRRKCEELANFTPLRLLTEEMLLPPTRQAMNKGAGWLWRTEKLSVDRLPQPMSRFFQGNRKSASEIHRET